MTKYPEIKVKLLGEDGNAFHILSKVHKAMTLHGIPSYEIKKFTKEAMAGDYDNLLRTVMEWVEVE